LSFKGLALQELPKFLGVREAAMNVQAILAAKGGEVVTIEPTADLAAATQLLSANRIGAVLIRGAGGHIAGILSERDIVRALSQHGSAALALPVGQVMTREVMTCTEDETIGDVMERMTSGKFRHLPVVSKGKLVGLISIGDVVKQRVDEIEHESEALKDYIRTA
jgi:CBS domain-containing protein